MRAKLHEQKGTNPDRGESVVCCSAIGGDGFSSLKLSASTKCDNCIERGETWPALVVVSPQILPIGIDRRPTRYWLCALLLESSHHVVRVKRYCSIEAYQQLEEPRRRLCELIHTRSTPIVWFAFSSQTCDPSARESWFAVSPYSTGSDRWNVGTTECFPDQANIETLLFRTVQQVFAVSHERISICDRVASLALVSRAVPLRWRISHMTSDVFGHCPNMTMRRCACAQSVRISPSR